MLPSFAWTGIRPYIMPVYIALLRGINVGNHKRMSMEALREACLGIGLEEATTILQSGNVVFRSNIGEPDCLRRQIEAAIRERFGFEVDVMLRTREEAESVLARSAFPPGPGREPSRLLILFLATAPTAEAKARVLAANKGPEEMHVDGREVYLHYPNGIGRSRLTSALLDRHLGVAGTARNWNTVTKLLQIAEQLER